MRIVKGLAVLVVLLFAAGSASAAGFRLPEAGAKAMGMGFAFTAQANDPSAIYFNPAGLTQLEGQNVMAGATYINEKGGQFTGSTPISAGPDETQKTLEFVVPNAYWTMKTSPNFAIGAGIFSPFGLGQEYNDRNTSIFRNQITKIDLKTLVFNPTIAWKVNDVLSLGAGIDFMWGQARLDKTPIVPGLGTFKVHLEGDGTAWGYNFGLLLKPANDLKVGFNFRSPFVLEIKDGDVTAYDNTFGLNAIGVPGSSKASATIRMPATAALGAAYTFLERFTVEVDADFTFWSTFSSLPIVNHNSAALSSDTPKRWRDVVAIRVGGEYRVTDPLALRLGFAYDPSPVPAQTMGPELPDADRLNYTAGVGYKYKNWTVDGSYFFLQKKDRTVSNIGQNGAGTGFNGTWKANAHLVALDIGYRF